MFDKIAIVRLTRELSVGALQVVGQKEKLDKTKLQIKEDRSREDVQMYE
jgi:hypothetical protein